MIKPLPEKFKYLPVLVACLVAVGAWFRFANLDQKVYWVDESITSLRLAGYSVREMVGEIFDGRVLSPLDVLRYQQLAPGKTLTDTFKSAASEDPHIPPLYYVLVRFWAEILGTTPGAIRAFSAFVSLLILPSAFLLCMELFTLPADQSDSSKSSSPIAQVTAWLTVAILALSPMQVLYAQEARAYSCLIVMILLSGYLFLLASRSQSKIAWVGYALSATCGLYFQPFFLYVIIAQAIYLWFSETKTSRLITGRYFLSAAGAALLLFSPWLYVILFGSHEISANTSWLTTAVPFSQWLKLVAFNLCRVFVDFDIYGGVLFAFAVPLIIALELYSLFYLYKQADKRIWLYVFCTIAVPALALVPADLAFGGMRALIARYFFPCYLGLQISVAYLFARKLVDQNFQSKIWVAALIILLTGEIASCQLISQAVTWWNKPVNRFTPDVANTINSARKPLVIACYNADNLDCANLLTLATMLDPKVSLEVVTGEKLPEIHLDASDVFVYMPTEGFRKRLADGLPSHLRVMDNVGLLWVLEKK
jgi:uncharacterized membrane protein